MPYLGNGMYQINNENTGESKIVHASDLPQYGLQPLNNPVEPNSTMEGGPVGNIVHGVASFLNNLPGGSYINSLLGAVNEGSRAVGSAMGAKNLYTNQQGQEIQDPFLSNQDLENFSSPQAAILPTAKNIASAESLVLPYAKGGILARLGIGGAGGLLNSVGDSPQQTVTNTVTGAGLNAISPILGIFKGLGGDKLAKAGQEISNVISNAESMPNKQGIIDTLLEKHFGTVQNPNTALLPTAPAQEQGNLLKLLKNEIAAQNRGSSPITNGVVDDITGGSPLNEGRTFQDIQNWKTGSGIQGKFNNNTTSATNRLFQNISGAYGNVMKEAVPDIAKPYADYAKAMTDMQNPKKGIVGVLRSSQNNPITKLIEAGLILNGVTGGRVGWTGFANLLSSPLTAYNNFVNNSWGTPANQSSGNTNNGW